MVNWKSNVFPGILGRTCDRPCEPACRRGRVEEEQRREARAGGDLPAQARRGRQQGRRAGAHAETGAARNGKRIACVGAGPASLTVARDLAPLGYEVTVFEADPKGGGFMRTQVPRFRLPESVIDEEVGYILDLGVISRGGVRIESMRALLGQGFDAVFVGTGAPRGRDLELPGRVEAAAASTSASTGWLRSTSVMSPIGKRVIVLGGGNTAMDCCRSARRLGGADVKVIVRSGFEEMKASPWEKEDADARGHSDPQLSACPRPSCTRTESSPA
jgi:NADPH-dependent glutamate synthase beta subunit-like oxidoreductase